MALAFMDEDALLVIATKNNLVTYWDMVQNTPRDGPLNWTRDFGENDPQLYLKRPTTAAFSIEQGLLAVIYRGEDILLWSLDGDQVYDMYTKESGSRRFEARKVVDGSTTVWTVAFSTTVEANLLVAAYSDGDVVVFDTDSGVPRGSIEGANAQTMSCSPDGRTLATGDSHGVIHLFDLKTLRFIYRIRFDTDAIRTKMLTFTSDNLRLLDIRGHQFRVWDPTVLLRPEVEDENSDVSPCSTMPQEVDYNVAEDIQITSMICLWDTPVVFCGKEDGSLHVCDTTSETRSQKLYIQTSNCVITSLDFNEQSRILICSDVAGRVTCRKVTRKPNMVWICDEPLIDLRNGVSVLQAITSGKHGRLLISTTQHDTLWALIPGSPKEYTTRIDGNSSPKWLASPLDDDLLVRFESNVASFFRWGTLERLQSVNLASPQNIPLSIESIAFCRHPQYFVTVQRERPEEHSSPTKSYLWDIRDFMFRPSLDNVSQDDLATILPTLDCSALSIKADIIIGVADERLVFLGPDNWVCSADINIQREDLNPTRDSPQFTAGAVRHFFIPYEWTSLINRILIDVRCSGELVLVKRAELVIIRRGLDITEKGAFNGRRVAAARALPRRPADRRHINI